METVRAWCAAVLFLAGCSVETGGLAPAAPPDAGLGMRDAYASVASDGGPDAGAADSGRSDAGRSDAGPPDAGPPPCVPEPETCNGRDDDCDGVVDPGAVCAPCTRGEREGHVYLFCVTSIHWPAARDACTARGYDLAVVDDAGEQSWLWSIAGPLSGDEYFIGLSDSDMEDTFLWIDGRMARVDGSDLLYTHWKTTAPDNSGDEDCVELDRGASGRWEDVPCDQNQSYICETR